MFDETAVRRLYAWVANPPRNCRLGLVELSGYFQSYKYFESAADSIIHPALAAPAAATRRAADHIVEVRFFAFAAGAHDHVRR